MDGSSGNVKTKASTIRWSCQLACAPHHTLLCSNRTLEASLHWSLRTAARYGAMHTITSSVWPDCHLMGSCKPTGWRTYSRSAVCRMTARCTWLGIMGHRKCVLRPTANWRSRCPCCERPTLAVPIQLKCGEQVARRRFSVRETVHSCETSTSRMGRRRRSRPEEDRRDDTIVPYRSRAPAADDMQTQRLFTDLMPHRVLWVLQGPVQFGVRPGVPACGMASGAEKQGRPFGRRGRSDRPRHRGGTRRGRVPR